jgi:predicted transcriptional regulator
MDNEEPDWLTELDREIINILGTNLVLTPSIIADNLDRSRKGVSNRLNALQAGGLVRKVERGKYELTEEGFRYMDEWSEIKKEDQWWYGKIDEIKEELKERRNEDDE